METKKNSENSVIDRRPHSIYLKRRKLMLNFNDWKKKKEMKADYEIVKSRSGLPMFVIEPPDSLNNLTSDDDDPVKKQTVPQIVRRVSDYISVHNN